MITQRNSKNSVPRDMESNLIAKHGVAAAGHNIDSKFTVRNHRLS